MERQDANAIAYRSDVTARMILSGSVDAPEWAQPLIQTLEDCTGMPGGRKWVQELHGHHTGDYMFSGSGTPGSENGPSTLKKKERPGYLKGTTSSSQFDFRDRSPDRFSQVDNEYNRPASKYSSTKTKTAPTASYFETQFESDFVPDSELRKHPKLTSSPDRYRKDDDDDYKEGSPFNVAPLSNYTSSSHDASSSSYTGRSSLNRDTTSHRRSISAYTPKTSKYSYMTTSHNRSGSVSSGSDAIGAGDSDQDYIEDLDGRPPATLGQKNKPILRPNPELTKPLKPSDGVARAIALYDFHAVQVRRERDVGARAL